MLSNVDHKAVANALTRGQGCAIEVKKMIENGYVPPESLVNTIVDSISLALSLMNATDPESSSSSSSQNMHMTCPPVTMRSPKKKICGREWFIDDLSPLIHDGFIWKKYGSKNIKTSPHKRGYFKCTHAKDQNCKAKKRVQKIGDDPLVYRTSYEGQHICKTHVFSHPICDDTMDRSMMIQFDKSDQSITSDLILPTPVSTSGDKATDHIMSLENNSNECLVDDDQFWASLLSPLSTENSTLGDCSLSVFDYGFF